MIPSLPSEFTARMEKSLGKEFSAFLGAFSLPPQKGLHVNTLKISSLRLKELVPFPLSKAVPWAGDCFYLEEQKAGGDILHFAGLYYLQEPSAMCAAPLLGVQRGERVLDLCAAPGGKTAQLAAQLCGEGLLVSNEIVPSRAEILSGNIERLGIENCAVTCASSEALSKKFPDYFDKILVDAPCSGEGMFRKDPAAREEWSLEAVRRCALRQREILQNAAGMLAGGGKMVYSTCTFSEEENERQIEDFLKKHPDFECLSQTRLLPHKIEGEGHFAAVLYKKEGARAKGRAFEVRRDAAAERAFTAFAGELLKGRGNLTVLKDGRLYFTPLCAPDFSGLKLLRLGTELGEWNGKIFRPAHALALSSLFFRGDEAKSDFPLLRTADVDREQAKRYLRGEELSLGTEDGYVKVCFLGYPLGWAKACKGVLKNHLPKALRMYSKE